MTDTAIAPRLPAKPVPRAAPVAARTSRKLMPAGSAMNIRPAAKRGDAASRRAFARFLAQARASTGSYAPVSQELLAELLKVSDRTIRNWEGEKTLPHPRHLPELIRALRLSPAEQRAAFLLVAGYECECAPLHEIEYELAQWVAIADSCKLPACVLAPDWRVLAVNGPMATRLPALAPDSNLITTTFGDQRHIARLGTRRQYLTYWSAPLAGRLLGDLAAPGRRGLIDPLITSALALPEFARQWRSTRWAEARVSSDGQICSVLDPRTGQPALHRLAAETFVDWPGVTLLQFAAVRGARRPAVP